MHPYAQTNIQLFNQLRDAGWSTPDLVYMHEVYWLMAALVSGQYRASGKPAIAHLIGTASILARHGAPVPVVAAGLLHGAFLAGDFGDGLPGMTRRRRQQVLRAAGATADAYVARFTEMYNQSQPIQSHFQHPDQVSPELRTLLFIRLADELDGYLDRGFAYYSERRLERLHLEANHQIMLELARQHGFQALAAELDQTYQEGLAAELPPELRGGHDDAFTIAPRSYSRRLPARLARWLKERLPVNARRWLRRQLNRAPEPGASA